ncbi:hypothetical protein SDC9_191387 [bioreactor metagenome]|uniref:Uncharacterized protein n=1 Tax=bioreactor metagenome TaxID=1076179 RepID=A0A645HZ12_9ZZZZ
MLAISHPLDAKALQDGAGAGRRVFSREPPDGGSRNAADFLGPLRGLLHTVHFAKEVALVAAPRRGPFWHMRLVKPEAEFVHKGAVQKLQGPNGVGHAGS